MIPFVVPELPAPSGGNVFNDHVRDELGLYEIRLDGDWPSPGPAAREDLAATLASLAAGSSVLLDGLVACGSPEIIVPAASRLRLTVLVHLPLSWETGRSHAQHDRLDNCEGDTLRAAGAVITTGRAAADYLVRRHDLTAELVHVAEPGTEPAPVASGTDGRSHLLCVASITPRKGHDVLVRALAAVDAHAWQCVCVGPVDTRFLAATRARAERLGISDRIRFTGPLRGTTLAEQYAAADLFVLPSRAETFGMVFTEALSRGIPVLATDTAPAAVGAAGILTAPDDVDAFAGALSRWFTEPALREQLRGTATRNRAMLRTWHETGHRIGPLLR